MSTDAKKAAPEETSSTASIECFAFSLAKTIEMDAKISLFGEEAVHTPSIVPGNSGMNRGNRSHATQKQRVVLQSIEEGTT